MHCRIFQKAGLVEYELFYIEFNVYSFPCVGLCMLPWFSGVPHVRAAEGMHTLPRNVLRPLCNQGDLLEPCAIIYYILSSGYGV